jgi:hypothetical protein
LHLLQFVGVKSLNPSSNIALLITNSLFKNIANQNSLFHANALRVLTYIIDVCKIYYDKMKNYIFNLYFSFCA